MSCRAGFSDHRDEQDITQGHTSQMNLQDNELGPDFRVLSPRTSKGHEIR